MRVKIVTEYCGINQYRIQVIVDGRVEEILDAYDYSVARVAHDACERWSKVADEVTPTEIPPATDMRRSKRF